MINWNQLWRQARAEKTWQGKTKKDWNERAAGFAKRHVDSDYVREFIDRLSLDSGMTVLDVGAGPGSLAIPVAKQVKSVSAVDFAPQMLAILHKRALEEGLSNITTIEGSWEDDWQALGIVPHDLVIASRSMGVDDLRGALEKLQAFARQRVIIGDRVGSGPFDPALFDAVGREFKPGPDYIYTVNILYQMGIHAHVDFIDLSPGRTYETRREARDSCSWMLGDLTPAEDLRLQSHLEGRLRQNIDGRWTLMNEVCPKWAIISWSKPDKPEKALTPHEGV